jgi:hypothetical protein
MDNIEIIIENPEQGIANFEPLKAAAQEMAAVYGSQLVSVDAIKDAKTDMAMLRKLAKSASDMRIKIEREHAAKIATVTKQLKEVAGIFTDAAAKIDSQVKAYDEERKAARMEEIKQIYADEVGDMADILPLARVMRQDWLNKSTTTKTVRDDLQAIIINAQTGIEQIKGLCSIHENAILSAFLERLSLADALAAKKRLEDMDAAMEKRRAEEEAAKKAAEAVEPVFIEDIPPDEEPPVEPVFIKDAPVDDEPTMDFTFTVKNATQAHLEALTAFLEENGYNYALEV